MLWFFFLYLYGHHRDLHSFPTRPFSDLPRAVSWRACCASPPASAWPPSAPRGGGVRSWRCSGTPSCSAARDRKSTRLNSSHANISYAVFCLKKKKNHKSRSQLLQKYKVG